MPQSFIEKGSALERAAQAGKGLVKKAVTFPADAYEAALAGLTKANPSEFLRNNELNRAGTEFSPFNAQRPAVPTPPQAPEVNLKSLMIENPYAELPENDPYGLSAGKRGGITGPTDYAMDGLSSVGRGFAGSDNTLGLTPQQAAGTVRGMSSEFDANAPMLSEPEMFRLANRDPRETAPGAGDYWKSQLASRQQTQQDERARLADIQAKSTAATLGGFDSPQGMAKWGRGLEEQKVGSPLAVAREGAQAQRDVANIGVAPQREFMELGRTLNAGGGLGPGDTLSISGLGSIHKGTGSQINPTLLRDLTNLRTRMVDSKGMFTGDFDETAKTAYTQSLSNVLRTMNVPDEVQTALMQDLTDPARTELPVSELIEDDGSPEAQAYARAMMAIRGY